MTTLRRNGYLNFWGGLSLAVVAAVPALAQNAVNLGTVQANGGADGTAGGTGSGNPASAPYQAPTQAPLNAIQPTSVINRQYIENNVPPSGSYDNIINIAPSVSTVSPNGPGLLENQVLSIRGFQDGQYNVTFDGIPWGDSNDFTHHTTSYFMQNDIGQTVVDRGPGTASTIGNATFGGTVSILSKDPAPTFQISPYGSYGSYNTALGGVEVDTGAIASANGATGFIDAEGLHSDGYLTNEAQTRKNFFTKFNIPLNDSSVLTFVAMYNTVHQNVGLGATKAQIAAYGPNYGLSSNPASQDYFGYNYDTIQTDFEYIGLKSQVSDNVSIDNKLYTYGYYHHGFNGEDPNGETPNGTYYGANDVPGQEMHNDYRSFGDIIRTTTTFDFGDIQAGLWVDHQSNDRQLLEVDYSMAGAPNPPGGNVDYNIHDTLDTVQPYVQLDWKPLPGLTISPGLKYNYFDRGFDATVNQKTQLPLNYNQAFQSPVPSLSVNYRFTPQVSGYAQVAEGFLAPNVNTFYTANPGQNSDQPQKSWNYQIGGVYRTNRLTVSGDAYYIDFSNLIGSRTVGADTEFFNQGGVTYKGLEAESTLYIGSGFSAYANGSLNSAKSQQTGQWIANAPDATAAFGMIYNRNGVYGSLIEKWVGSRFGDVGQTQGLQPYGVLNASLAYTHKKNEGPAWLPAGTFRLVFDNLLNTTVINGLAGYTVANNTPLYWTVPGRAVFASATLTF
jgi:iron complex outermembrane recepter protein